MTIEELLVAERSDRIRELGSAWARFEAEARAQEQRRGLRRSIADALVWLGMQLDRGAGERIALRSHAASR